MKRIFDFFCRLAGKIKTFVGVHFVVLTLTAGSIALLAVLGAAGYGIWLYRQPKFHDLTVELGTNAIGIADFMTEYANPKKAHFVTDVTTVDIGQVGEYPLTLANGRQEQTVLLTVQDTTPPEVVFVKTRLEHTDYVPDPMDFVESVYDLAETTVTFDKPVTVPENYGTQVFYVVVKDASGNETRQTCRLQFEWMPTEYQLELGQTLTAADLLYCPEKDGALLPEEALEAVNSEGVGTYRVWSFSGAKAIVCIVTISDTTGPELVLKDCQTYVGVPIAMEKFVESATDLSGEVTLEMLTQPDVSAEGTQTVVIQARDIWGNVTTAEATLSITRDFNPPSIGVPSTSITVAKHSAPDYMTGVYAIDAVDGNCKVTYDDSAVNVDVAGTYYVTYYARDKSGNVASLRRKVIVAHDAEDTKALVDQIAAGLGSDPEALRDYVRGTIGYNHNWGGDDPVWYGFTTKGGNCYVHALCLRELLTRKGYTTQLIWTTNKTHYWLLINLNGVWRHIDPTPSSVHSIYSLMTDDQRLSTLSGRDWDRSAWPACN